MHGLKPFIEMKPFDFEEIKIELPIRYLDYGAKILDNKMYMISIDAGPDDGWNPRLESRASFLTRKNILFSHSESKHRKKFTKANFRRRTARLIRRRNALKTKLIKLTEAFNAKLG